MTAIEFQQTVVSASSDSLRRLALRLTQHNEQNANDLVNETVLKALDNQDKYRYAQNLKGWLSTIMRNIFFNQYKRTHQLKTRITSTAPDDFVYISHSTVDNAGEQTLYVDDIQHELHALSDTIRQPFMMYFYGYSYQEIADELDISVGAVKTRIFNARRKLRVSLAHLNPN